VLYSRRVYRLVRPLLFLLPPEAAHRLVMRFLRLFGRFPGLCRRLHARATRGAGPGITVGGVQLAHPVTLAAGLDKDGEAILGLFALGFSAVEVGTVTPRPQPGNPKPRIFRLGSQRGLLNKMGFPSAGAVDVARRLHALRGRGPLPGPVGVNIGKNKDTPLDRAAEDYLACLDILGDAADFFVVNVSSPNTPDLRKLLEPEPLRALLTPLRARTKRPLFLKLSPDLEEGTLDQVVEVAIGCGVDALIATNTTVAHGHLDKGGLSGAPLRDRATSVLARAALRAAGRVPLVGVGGISTGADVDEKLRSGASAVQIYTGLIYEGPGLVRRLIRQLATFNSEETPQKHSPART
jgi:dihydroorotate dehydrogenase